MLVVLTLQVATTLALTVRLLVAVPAKAGLEIRVLPRARVEPIRAAVRTEQREERMDMVGISPNEIFELLNLSKYYEYFG
jgi:hypothetical protein